MKNAKKLMRLSTLMTMLVILAFVGTAGAQCKEFKWPEDKKKAEECVAIWGDALKQGGNLQSAVPAIQWMIANAPQWNTKVYIDGVTITINLRTHRRTLLKRKAS
jgi:hypothetical protein